MSSLNRLVHDLQREGFEVTALPGPAQGFAVVARPELEWPRPVQISVTEQVLEDCLTHLESDGSDLFPDVNPAEAAYRLFLVHLHEGLSVVGERGTSTLRVSRSGVEWDPLPPLPGLPAVEELEREGVGLYWSAVRPPSDPSTT